MKVTQLAFSAILGLAGVGAAMPASAAAIFVSAQPSSPTIIGSLLSGQSYTVTAAGIAGLCINCNNGGALLFTADGKPSGTFSATYSAFSPNGLDFDPTGSSFPGTGGRGQGGTGKLIGSLLGTFVATPTGPADFFTIGLGTTLTATADEFLYAVINDTFYSDNVGGSESGYAVTLTQNAATGTAVPEPASMLVLGAGLAGISLVRRGKIKIKTESGMPVV